MRATRPLRFTLSRCRCADRGPPARTPRMESTIERRRKALRVALAPPSGSWLALFFLLLGVACTVGGLIHLSTLDRPSTKSDICWVAWPLTFAGYSFVHWFKRRRQLA